MGEDINLENFNKYYDKALRFLSFRPRSEKEIRDYFKKKKVEESLISKIINKLKDYNFLNDEEFTKWWIEQRTKFKPRSLRLIKIELRQKGISDEIIDFVMSNFKCQISNDKELAKKLVEKKLIKYKNLPKEVVFRKISQILISKGFSYEIVKETFKSFYSNSGVDEI